jgi:hypothetical protein
MDTWAANTQTASQWVMDFMHGATELKPETSYAEFTSKIIASYCSRSFIVLILIHCSTKIECFLYFIKKDHGMDH